MATATIDAPPAPPPAPTTAIKVSALPGATAAPAPVKPGSARERMFSELQKKAVTPGQPPPSTASSPVTPPVTAPADPAEDPNSPGQPSPEGGVEQPAVEPNPAAGTPAEKGKKPSPWKLMEEYKARATKLEAELLEARKGAIPEAERKQREERQAANDRRLQELEDEIRFVSYSKSQEFQDKYQAPYESAWKRAMGDLGEIVITDEVSGQQRQIQPEDILSLVNMPLPKAREVANQLYGDFANDVMDHRKEIKRLSDEQQHALDEARKTGSDREKQMAEHYQKATKEVSDQIRSTWDQVNRATLGDAKYGTYFKPADGDQEGNQRLAKGFELVDRAFSENPSDPRLKPEERDAIIKRHAAVRNRAAAFSRVMLWYEREKAEHAKTKAELAKFKSSEPGSTSANGNTPPVSGPLSARQQMYAALTKIAK